MKSMWKSLIRSSLAIGVGVSLSTIVFAQDDGQAGVVRVSKPRATNVSSGQVMPVSAMMVDGGCAPTAAMPAAPAVTTPSAPVVMSGSAGMYGNGGRSGRHGYYRQDWRDCDWQSTNTWGSSLHARTQASSLAFEHSLGRSTGYCPSIYYHDPSGQAMVEYFKCKFGYFIPTGGGGQGVPWVGKYGRVYPVNPAYSDQRDGQTWAAQGYGVPMAVPLAPVVGHTFDYGWGVPSSRMTPVSHPAY